MSWLNLPMMEGFCQGALFGRMGYAQTTQNFARQLCTILMLKIFMIYLLRNNNFLKIGFAKDV